MKNKKVKIDLRSLEPVDHLDEEEKALHDALQAGEFHFDNSFSTINRYAEIFKESNKQRKAISLRIPTQDYIAIKSKALEMGLPYQALINSLIHRYVTGGLRDVS